MHCILNSRHIGQRSFAFPNLGWCPLLSGIFISQKIVTSLWQQNYCHWRMHTWHRLIFFVPCRAVPCFFRLFAPTESLWQKCLPKPKEANNEINPSFCFAAVAVAGQYKFGSVTESSRALEWRPVLFSMKTPSWPYYWHSITFQCLAMGKSTTDTLLLLLVREIIVWALWTTTSSSFCFICLWLLYFTEVEQSLPADCPWNWLKSLKLASNSTMNRAARCMMLMLLIILVTAAQKTPDAQCHRNLTTISWRPWKIT